MQTREEISAKPRVLIADDSRIVRATLIKHIEGMFEFREAADGEQAWEALLIDPSIRVVITDLTMPRLDGYGLLQRIRSSKISRIREIPVVVISGSDEKAELERVKLAGANDLITKGIGTAQLLSRLDVLAKLVSTQREFERSLEVILRNANGPDQPPIKLPSAAELHIQAEALLDNAIRNKKNFVALNVSVGLKHTKLEGSAKLPSISMVEAVGELLQRTIRQTDLVAKTGEAAFTLVTGSINFDSARHFAQRVCNAIANADLVKEDSFLFIASCGLVSLSEYGEDVSSATLDAMLDAAARRSAIGIERAIVGVVGTEEESALLRGDTNIFSLNQNVPEQRKESETTLLLTVKHDALPDLTTIMQWIKEGKEEKALPYIDKLALELQPLIHLLLKKV